MWAVPAAIVLVTAVPALMLILRLAEETRQLTGELRRLGELRPAMVELRTDAQSARAALARLHRPT